MKPHPATWFVYPSLLFGVVGATQALLGRDVPLPLVSSSVLLGTMASLMVLERAAPFHRTWNGAPALVDVVLLFFNRLVDVAVIAATVGALAALERHGVELGAARVWPKGAPLVLQAALGIFVAEGVRYALHRASHAPGVLWRWHRVHHQPSRMYTLNGPRLHPANHVWVAAAHVVPMLVLGAELRAVVMTASVTGFFVLFQHANVSLSFVGLNRVFATPDVHRWHHARALAGADVNYGIVLLVFDRLFGTYRAANGADDAIGERAVGLT